MKLWLQKRLGISFKSLGLKKRKKKMKQSNQVQEKDLMLGVLEDTEILDAEEIPESMVHLEVPKEDKKMKGILDSCCKQEDFPKYDISNSKSTCGEASNTSCDGCMDVFSITDLIPAPSCKHRFCKDCIETYLQKEIQEDATHVECPESTCKAVLMPDFCRRLIPEQVFDRWKSELVLASAFGRREIECPYFDCLEVFMDDGKGYNTRACPNCWNLICMRCGRVEWHVGEDCETFRTRNLYVRRSAYRRTEFLP